MRRVAAAALTVLPSVVAAAEVVEGRFPSASLGREVAYSVHLPPSYADGKRTYPVVYALHGLFESPGFWSRRGLAAVADGLWADGKVPEMVVFAVDGENSFFVNGPLGRYEDMVTRDTLAYAEAAFRVARNRDGRVLLGVSMGGYAALRIGLAHPRLFGAVATHSAMLLEGPPTRDAGASRGHMAAFAAAFGDPIDASAWSAADPLHWAGRVRADDAPALYFDCGRSDRYGLAAGNRELHRRLVARGVRHEFALLPGDHGYDYVRSVLTRSLLFLAKAVEP